MSFESTYNKKGISIYVENHMETKERIHINAEAYHRLRWNLWYRCHRNRYRMDFNLSPT